MPNKVFSAVLAASLAVVVIVVASMQFGEDGDEAPAGLAQRRGASRGDVRDFAVDGIREGRNRDERPNGGALQGERSKRPNSDAAPDRDKEAAGDGSGRRERRAARIVAQIPASGVPAGVSPGGGSLASQQGAAVADAIAEAGEHPARGRYDDLRHGAVGGAIAGEFLAGADDDEPLFESGSTPLPTNGFVQYGDIGEITADAGTLSFKVRPGWDLGSQEDATMVELGDGTMRIRKNVSFLRFEYVNEDGYEGGIGVPIPDWQNGEEHHVVGSWSGGTLWLYVDGKLAAQGTREGVVTLPEQPRLGIGSRDAHLYHTARGQVYEVEALNRPLTAAEVAERAAPKQAAAD